MRGKEAYAHMLISCGRITPAYAGKSHSVPASLKVLRDHPRLCGEKSSMIFLVQSFLGSPPPMRGKAAKSVTCSGVK